MQFPQYPTPRNYKNIPSGYPICAIVSYKANGELIPRWFGVVINHERFRYEITAIKSIRNNGNVLSYECVYKSYEQTHTVILRFDILGKKWVIG